MEPPEERAIPAQLADPFAADLARHRHAEGAELYQQSFGYRYIDYDTFLKARDPAADPALRLLLQDPRTFVLMPDALYDRFDPASLFAGKRVLIVGNGPVEERTVYQWAGFDQVIRLNALYGAARMAASAYRRAVRCTTIWAGLPKPNVAQGYPIPGKSGGDRDARPGIAPEPGPHPLHAAFRWIRGTGTRPGAVPEPRMRTPFLDILPTVRTFWVASPFEISAAWLDTVLTRRKLADIVFTPSFHHLDSLFAGRVEARIRQPLAAPRFLADGRGGWPAFNVLLTGTRLAVLAALGGPRLLRLEGFDFYASGQGQLWQGHHPLLDRAALGLAADLVARQGGHFELRGLVA